LRVSASIFLFNNGSDKLDEIVINIEKAMGAVRNPKWHRDEIILALNLYFKLTPGQIHARNPEIIALSSLLNELPVIHERPDAERFRNPNGVGLKLSNFLAIDPGYEGKGMASYSKSDAKIFFEFQNNQSLLNDIASQIKQIASNPATSDKIGQSSFVDEQDDFEVKEGKILYRLHRYRERVSEIVKKKKQIEIQRSGALVCEVCDFDFYQTYGKVGLGFIECHHRIPLWSIEVNAQTKLSDLALVCSNCHRMLHRTDSMSIELLRKKLADKKS
jgi:5-methylcytosine-specific restriction protein A